MVAVQRHKEAAENDIKALREKLGEREGYLVAVCKEFKKAVSAHQEAEEQWRRLASGAVGEAGDPTVKAEVPAPLAPMATIEEADDETVGNLPDALAASTPCI